MPNESVYRDSVSKCEVYSNPYDTRNLSNEALANHRKETYLNGRDHLETTRKRLERQTIDRVLSNNRMIIIVQVGKYLFLAIMVPPYILFYGVPKWLFLQGFPLMFAGMKSATQYLNQLLMNLGKIQTKMMKAITGLNLMKQLEKFQKAFKTIQNAIVAIVNQTQTLTSRMMQPLFKFGRQITSTTEKVANKMNEWNAQLKKAIESTGNTLTQQIQKAYEWMKPNFNFQFTWMHKGTEATKQFVIQFRQRIQKIVTTPIKFVGKITHQLLQIPQRLTQPIINWSKPKIEKVGEIINRVNERLNRIRERTKKITKSISETTKKAFTTITQLIPQNVAQPVINLFVPLVNRGRNFIKKIKGTRVTLIERWRQFKKKLNQAKERFKRGYQAIIKGIKKGYTSTKKAVLWTTFKIISLSKKLFQLLVRAFFLILMLIRKILTILRKILTFFRIIIVATFLVIRYGMKMVREAVSVE